MSVRARILVSGSVQGVFFRASTREQAQRLGVTGWVRNLLDGQVEAVLEGDRESVIQLMNWCRKGPPGARVTDLKVEWGSYSGEFETFSIAYGR